MHFTRRNPPSKGFGGGKAVLRRLLVLAGLLMNAGVLSAQDTNVAFHYAFPTDSPDTDSGPSQRTLTFGKRVEFIAGTEGIDGIKLSPVLDSRAFFEDSADAESSILHRMRNSEWTLEFWIKLDEISDRSQMLFCIQPAGESNSDLTLRLQPEKDTPGNGTIVLADATTIVRAKSSILEWKTDTWYFIAIVSTPSGSGTYYTIYRGDKTAGGLSEVYQGSSDPLVARETEKPRVFQFANFWGNFGKDALAGVMGNTRLTWRDKENTEIEKTYREGLKQ